MTAPERNFDPEDLLTIRDVACLAGTTARAIQRMLSFDLIEPARTAPEPCFRCDVIVRVRRMRRLHVELGVSWSSMGIVLELLDRLERTSAPKQEQAS